MHILFLTDNFPPESNAPASRTFDHCREWVEQGHEVTVITCAPNFPKGVVFSGYKNALRSVEWMSGVRVVRVWSYIAPNEGFLRRTLDYLTFMISGTFFALGIKKVDIVVGTSPQFFTACAAFLVGAIKRVPWVFELRDLWPESIKAVGALDSSFALRALEFVESFLYQRASAIVSVTESFKRTLASRGVDPRKIFVVTNGVDMTRFYPREKHRALLIEHGLEDKFVVGYIGTHGMAHALETILDAAAALRATADGDRFRFLFVGEGASKSTLLARAKAERLDNVIFVDAVGKNEVANYWSILDVAVIHLKKTELFTTVIPSKLFECMGMGIPILHGVAGESAMIVERHELGRTFQPESQSELIAALEELERSPIEMQNIRRNGPKSAAMYDRRALASRMLGVLESVVQEARSKKC